MSTTRRGFSVTVFLPGADPEGLKVVEKSNWTGRGLVIPRSMFGESKSLMELARPGVYFLVGPGETSTLPTLYVGAGNPVRPRLEQHSKRKDFWTHAVVFTSKDPSLNKAHVQRLESQLVERAQAAKRCVLENGNIPKPPSLSEADEAMVDGFLDDLLLCLPIIGYSLFEVSATTPTHARRLQLRAKGIAGTGIDTPGGFVVFRGARAVGDNKVAPLAQQHLTALRADLVRQGVLVPDPAGFTFSQDYTFPSPSTAAGVLLGRSANGRKEWRTQDGRTLKQMQEAEAAE